MIGGGGERKTLRLAARHGDIWHGFGDGETVRHKNAVLDDWCVKEGRNPGDIERSTAVPGDLVGTRAPELYDVGTRLITTSSSGPRYDLGPLRELIAWRDQVNATR
jgi:alkanesulfonate monooxygenase SsuD/methylene tetrahydromethanopterin reductase-like flavin-dependent oxidoreductase (luciferase family)